MKISDLEKKVTLEMEQYFNQHPEHIEHTKKVLGYARQIMKEEGGDREVIIASALLHDIGLLKSMEKHNSYAGKYQQIEGPPVARKILEEAGASQDLISEVCDIVGSHHTRGVIDTINFHVIWDADWLVNFATHYSQKDDEKKKELIEKLFITETGNKLARQIYLGEDR
ncbi:MAG: HD domain-containing protein [Actinomycetota bacterium]|nr:HD domain-containing protein [Actinomycetota bacterium]